MAIGTNQITDTLTPTTGTMNVVGTLQQNGNNIAVYPTQTGNAGRFLTTDGSNVSWATVSGSYTGTALLSNIALTTTNETTILSLPVSGVASGMVFNWSLTVDCTANPTGTVKVYIGSTGTTSDTLILTDTATFPSQDILYRGSLTFNGATSLANWVYSTTRTTPAFYGGATTGLTISYITITAQSSSANVITAVTANIMRVL